MPDVIGTLFHKEIPYGGVKGDKGDTGATPNVSATASVNSSTGTPSVNVVKTGTAENPSFEFAFSNLKGEKGDPGSGSSVDWGDIDGTLSDQTDLSTELGKKYDENDTAETDIADDDYVPFYDTSATGKRKSLWSNIKAKLKAYFDTIYTLLTIVGTVESGTTASKAYAIGEHFIRDGAFCTAIAAIAQGATFTLNTNYTQGDVAGAIEDIDNIIKKICPSGTYNLAGVIVPIGASYQMAVYLTVPAKYITSITCSEFRPSGQTAVKDTTPTVSIIHPDSNCIILATNNSSFSPYAGKAGTAALTITY